jgi:hypothetical protein
MSPVPRLRCREVPDLPKLAWIATLDLASGELVVDHGCAVERRDEWVVEGVWDGDFAAGDFHVSDHFFGSGIRVQGAAVYFVPAGALVDRLLYCRERDHLLVSNSLPLLLARTGARLARGHDYRRESYAIRRGVAGYEPEFVVAHPEISAFTQLYDECLVVEEGRLAHVATRAAPPIASFDDYHARTAGALRRLRDNARSPARRAPLSLFATISSGYDSAAAAALVRHLGVSACFTSGRSNSHWPSWLARHAAVDDGKPIADRLGLRSIYLDPRLSRIGEADELFFLAASCAPAGLVFHSMASHMSALPGPAVLFTGFLGDEVWEETWERAYHYVGIVRGDTSALTLSEIRLQSGFINVAVPALCARRIQDVAALTESPEMAPWRLGTEYDRPIPRRLVEEAGVPRSLFARRKKAVVRTRSYPVHRRLRRAFLHQLRSAYGISRATVYLGDWLARLGFYFRRSYYLVRRWLTSASPPDTPGGLVSRQRDFASLLFVWAADTLADRLAVVLAHQPDAVHSAPRPVPHHAE